MKKLALALALTCTTSAVFAENKVTMINDAIFNKTASEVIKFTANRTTDGGSEAVIVANGLRYTIIADISGDLSYYIRPNGTYSSGQLSLISYSAESGNCTLASKSKGRKLSLDEFKLSDSWHYSSDPGLLSNLNPEYKMSREEGKNFCDIHLSNIANVYDI